MPDETVSLLRSIRRWLLILVILLGVGVVTLSNTGYVTSGYQNGLVYAIAGVTGGAIALAAALSWVNSFSPRNSDTH